MFSFQKQTCHKGRLHPGDGQRAECMPLNNQFIISICPNWPNWINGKAFMDWQTSTCISF